MRKWTLSACVVLAWCILHLVAVAGSSGPGRPVAQANISTATSISTAASTSAASSTRTATNTRTASSTGNSSASSTRVILASESVTAMTADATAGPAESAATWTVRPGDTLSAIAAALGVSGGWQALYAANQQAIGPDPNLIRAGTVLAVPGRQGAARYTVAPGDTLSAIAAALGVSGGWQALYAANKRAVGPDPDVIRPGTVLVTPRPPSSAGASPAARPGTPRSTAPVPSGGGHPRQAPTPAPAGSGHPPVPAHQAPAPSGKQSASHPAVPGHATGTGGMPRWLEDVLLAAGVLAASAFAAEPAAAFARRRRQAPRPARPRAPRGTSDLAEQAIDKARIILADHDRLIVTYCASDHTVYVLTPPGEDPRAVLRAARLILPEDTYEDLAGHLGISSAWPLE